MWKSNLNSQKMYVNFWEVYILRALLASIINPDVKISTFFSLHTKNHHTHTHTSELSGPFTADGEALLELCLSLPSAPVFIKRFCVLLRCSLIPSSLRQFLISLAFSPSFTSSPVSSPLPSVHAVTSVVSDSLQPYGLQAPLSMGFSRQESWSRLPCSSPGAVPNIGIEPGSLISPVLAGRFLTRHSSSFTSSLVSSPTPISSLFKRKTTNRSPWHMQG